MHNHVILTGRFTHTPELRQTLNGISVCTFGIAVQRRYNKNSQEQGVDFIDVEAWRGTAEFISKYFDKGDMIDITGSLKTYRWQENDMNRHKTVVLAESVDFSPTNKRKSVESDIETTEKEKTDNIPEMDVSDFIPVGGDETSEEDMPF